FTVPLNDRKLTPITNGWKRGTRATAYLGTYTGTRAGAPKGQALSYGFTKVTSFSLIAATGPNQGTVQVKYQGKVLRTINLGGPATGRSVFKIADFAAMRSGTLRIITTNKKPVQIGGLAAVTRP
ncbi:MAG: hypothetical protein Q7T71_12095, partial [Herbiconiux sp.]|nr:hypothetical protein [Herbiconiux sp.]